MAWENEKNEDKNLESLRNQFSLENIMDSKVVTDSDDLEEMGNGQFRLYHDGTDLYLYSKFNDELYYFKFTKA